MTEDLLTTIPGDGSPPTSGAGAFAPELYGLPPDALLFPFESVLTFSGATHLHFSLHSLCETEAGTIEAGLGVSIDSGVDATVRTTFSGGLIAAVTFDDDGRLRLRIMERREPAPGAVTTLRVAAALGAPPSGLVQSLSRSIAGVYGAEEGVTAGLAGKICEQAAAALEKKHAAWLSWQRQSVGGVLAGRMFDFTPEGLDAYRNALVGNLDAGLMRPPESTMIDVHLPFLGRKEWPARGDALANAEVRAEGSGRLLVHTACGANRPSQQSVGDSTLTLAGPLLFSQDLQRSAVTFTDCRSGPRAHLARLLAPLLRAYGFGAEAGEWLAAAAGETAEADLSLSISGGLLSAWLRAPAESDSNFFEVYSKVSVAVQQAMRRWLPYAYFCDPERYEDVRTARPLIFYQSTRPFSGEPRSDFAYDLVSPDRPGVARSSAARPLASEMGRVYQALMADKRLKLARLYAQWRVKEILNGIVQQPRLINALLTTDAFFIDQFVRLGMKGRELSVLFAENPRRAVKELAIFADDFAVSLQRKLRRLYNGQDFSGFASLLLVEAARALAAALDGDAAVSATLRLRAGGREQTFVNATFQP